MPSKKVPENYQLFKKYFPDDKDLYLFYQAWSNDSFKNSIKHSSTLFKRHPKNPMAIFIYAVMLGDGSIIMKKKTEKTDRLKAARMLKAILPKVRGKEFIRMREIIRNEYYFMSYQPLKQYKLGLECEARNAKNKNKKISYPKYRADAGLYSQGVGSSILAYNYLEKGNLKKCFHWAKVAVKTWEKLNLVRDNHFQYDFYYIQALAMTNEHKKAMSIYKKAIKKVEYYQDIGKPMINVCIAKLEKIKMMIDPT